ncbi:GTP:adenosylcobinamide-phosphate guanylyltransferase [Hydrogenispora ethanolica]|jgi:GTP:adenosylcobinamide-phosphate guanylyltransferase|uniref:GTP:adenosylcobinamide-phosphate guanylyltransferase n=1 Tax=Hydrogenispora ethanolica TaxID=1082276 RepID=A0A4R1SA15_HYDET|nr:nucleotidyltransferase family protein [Hydrogenispora ethanolica]TCL76343.1 GTP:adenosylcobinamide-phosphate guanylyltransferase [Hydrogenispora ethanolica]
MDAVILAGALNSGPLRAVSSAQYEAAIEIAGRPMLDYVVKALQNVASIRRIIIVGNESAVAPEIRRQAVGVIEPGGTLVDSLIGGLNALQSAEPVLVATSDIPLITREAVEDFLSRCSRIPGDVYYSFVSKELNEAKYPGVQRTYVTLREGTFTGGNLALIAPRVVEENAEMLRKAALLRKKPWKLCQMLGWRYLWKLLCGNLTIAEIEQRVRSVFGIRAVGIISPFPEVGIDVDKPSDFRLATEVLSK